MEPKLKQFVPKSMTHIFTHWDGADNFGLGGDSRWIEVAHERVTIPSVFLALGHGTSDAFCRLP